MPLEEFDIWVKSIGERLLKMRIAKNLTAKKVSETTGLTIKNIQRIEEGSSGGIRLYEALKLGELYGKSIAEIAESPIDKDEAIDIAVNALKSFSPELREHHSLILKLVQHQLEFSKRYKEKSIDPFAKK